MAEEASFMRRKRSLIILLAVLVLLAGTYAFLASRPQDTNEPDKSEPAIEISKLDRSKIKRITLKNSKIDELVFELETRVVEEEGEDGEKETSEETVWVSKKPYPVELAQSTVSDLISSFSSLNAEMIVEENSEDLAKYGLDKPSATATAELDDGTKVTLFLGNKTAEGSTFYLMKDGDTKVYTVRSAYAQRLNSSLSDFRDKSLAEIDITNLNYMLLTGEGRRDLEIVTTDNLPNKEDAYGYSTLFMTKPFKRVRAVDMTKLNPILEQMAVLSIKDFVDDHPTDLAKYGLDNPKLHLVLKDANDSTLDLYFGNSLEDGTIYFKTGDSDAVYLMDESAIASLDFQPMDISDKFALLVNIDNVDKVVFEGRGIKHTMTITRTVKKAEEGEEDETVAAYYFDGQETDEEDFKRFYQSLIGIVVDTEKIHTAQGTPEFMITYYLNKGIKRELSVALYPYDNDFYSMVREGDMESEFLVYKKRLNWIFEDLEKFLSSGTDEE